MADEDNDVARWREQAGDLHHRTIQRCPRSFEQGASIEVCDLSLERVTVCALRSGESAGISCPRRDGCYPPHCWSSWPPPPGVVATEGSRRRRVIPRPPRRLPTAQPPRQP